MAGASRGTLMTPLFLSAKDLQQGDQSKESLISLFASIRSFLIIVIIIIIITTTTTYLHHAVE